MKRLLAKILASIALALLVAQTSCTPAQQQTTVQTAQAVAQTAQAAAQVAQAASDVAQVLALFRGMNVAGAPATLANTAGIAGKEETL
jgi:uncharacterized protein with PhoU and TrkA domain